MATLTREQSRLMIENLATDAQEQHFSHLAKYCRDILQSGSYHDVAEMMRNHVLWTERQKAKKQKGTVFEPPAAL